MPVNEPDPAVGAIGPTLAGRHAIVTGGARGIGAAIAAMLYAEGMHVSVLATDAGRANRLAGSLTRPATAAATTTREPDRAAVTGPRAQGLACDVRDEGSVQAAFAAATAKFGSPAVLVNNAGVAHSELLARTTTQDWLDTMAVNLTGTFFCTRAVLSAMRTAGFGRIVNIASTAGLRGYAYVAPYVASKHGVIGLTRALALELADVDVTVNAVCPGFTDTDMVAASVQRIVAKTGRTPEAARAELTRNNPQRRLVEVDEVAAAVRWLCQPESRSITGQSIAVAGGEVM